MASIKITVDNWEKFNPRSDRANYSWFRFQNSYFSDQGIFMLTDSQLALHVFCICELSKKNSTQIELRSEYIAAMRRRSEGEIIQDIAVLSELGLLAAQIDGVKPADWRPSAVIEPSLLPATNVRTNETIRDERDVHAVGGKPPPRQRDATVSDIGEIKTNEFIAAYSARWKHQWKTNPPMSGKEAGIAKRIAKGLSRERAELLLDAYFSLPDAGVRKAHHPLNLFELKMHEVVVFADTGTFTTFQQARQEESHQTTLSQLERIERGLV